MHDEHEEYVLDAGELEQIDIFVRTGQDAFQSVCHDREGGRETRIFHKTA